MNYTLHQLYIFTVVADTQSITRAAELLHMTQPAVSIQLKNLQAQFEIPLTEVIGRRLFLTDFGREMAAHAREIIAKAQDIDRKVKAYKGLLVGKLKVASVSTGKYILPFYLSSFLDKNPVVELQMDVTNKEGVMQALRSNAIDLALVSILPNDIEVEHIPLMPNELYMVSNAALYRKHRIGTLKDLENIPLIFREIGSGTRQAIEYLIQKHNLMIQRRMELTSNEAVKQSVLAGLGYSIMPIIGIRKEISRQEIKIHPLPELPLVTTWQIIWLKGKKLAPVCKAFLNHVRTNPLPDFGDMELDTE